MNITNSPDITKLLVRFVVDLSGKTPKLTLENLSEGPNLNGVVMAFEAYSPNGVQMYKSTLDNPDAVGNFITLDLDAEFAMFNRKIEFSGNPYTFIVHARDSVGNVFKYLPEQTAKICAPAGNQSAGKHYGAAKADLEVDCNRGEVLIKDIGNYSYSGLPGQLIDTSITVLSPADETGEVPAPKKYDGFSQVAHPLAFSGTGFKAVLMSTRRYDLPNNVSVIIKYILSRDFEVNCHYDLCPLFKEYGKLLEKAEKSCDAALDNTIGLINAKLVKAIVAKMQPSCGYDIAKIIDEIKKLGNFDVDCSCGTSTGFNVMGSTSGGGDLVITFTNEGDVTGTAIVNGKNVSLDIRDFKYIFNVTPFGAGTQSFKLNTSTNGRVRTVTLTVDRSLLASELLSTIETDQQLLNKLRELTAANFEFIVDGKGVIQTNPRCDQELTMDNVPADSTFVLLKSITIDGIIYMLNYSVNGTPASINGLNAKLAALNQGLITAAFLPEGVLRIATVQNPRKMNSGVVYFPGVLGDTANRIMMYRTFNCTNAVPYQPSTIVQAIIDYLMRLTIDNVKIGSDVSLCKLNADGTTEQVQLLATDSIHAIIDILRNNSCRAINTPNTGNTTLTCETVRALFAEKIEVIQPTDVILGTRNGKCGVWSMEDVIKRMSAVIISSNDKTLTDAWCAAVGLCYTDAQVCNPVSFAEAKMDLLDVQNFILSPGTCNADPEDLSCLALIYVGRYINDTLDFPITVNIRDRVISTGVMGLNTRNVVMNAGSNLVQDVFATNPGAALGIGREWAVESITLPGAGLLKKYLQIRIKNSGSANYKVAYRVKGSSTPFVYTTVPAQKGAYTVMAYDVPENQYEASVLAVCGPGNESTPITVDASNCPAALSFNVVRSGQNFAISYQFPAGIAKFNLRVQFPNNGGINQVYDVAVGGTLQLPIPSGVYGNYSFEIRAVCNEASGWFGPFTGAVVVAVPAPANACPLVSGVEINNITGDAADIHILVPGDLSNVAGYTITLTAPDEAPRSQAVSGLAPVWHVTGLTGQKRYTVGVVTNCAGGVQSSVFNGGDFITTAPAGLFRVYWGTSDSPFVPNLATIESSPNFGDHANGADVVADWRYNMLTKYLWVAIPQTQTVKNHWIGSPSNQGDIGPFPLTFAAPQAVVQYNVYITNFPTQQRNTPITFLEV